MEKISQLEKRKQIIPYGSDRYLVNLYLASRNWEKAEKIIESYEYDLAHKATVITD